MAVALPFIALAFEIGTSVYGGIAADRRAKQQRDFMREQEERQLAMQQEFQQRQAQQDQDASASAAAAAARQRAVASGYANASETNFTSPMGMPGGGASTTNGSLLGL